MSADTAEMNKMHNHLLYKEAISFLEASYSCVANSGRGGQSAPAEAASRGFAVSPLWNAKYFFSTSNSLNFTSSFIHWHLILNEFTGSEHSTGIQLQPG